MNFRKILSLLYHKTVTGKKPWDNLKLLKKWQWLPPEQLKTLCDTHRKDLLAYAANHVPYYGKILRSAGVVDAVGNVNLENFTRIPLLDKDILRREFEALTSDERPKLKGVFTNNTGGSTGEPNFFLQDRQYQEWNYPSTLVVGEWSGYSFGQKRISIWGATDELLHPEKYSKFRWKRWLNNEIFLNSIMMTPEKMNDSIQTINRIKPPQIISIAECVYDLARYIEHHNLQVHSPRSIVTSAGTLFPYMREKIQEVFHAPVFNQYGSHELGMTAYECEEHNGLHVVSPVRYLEILRPDGTPTEPGEFGEIVATLLYNKVMPLIRFRIDDIAAWAEKPCPCGRSWPLLKEIKGRISDIFVSRDGTHIHGQFFVVLICYFNWVRKFQIVQEDYDLVKIYIDLIEKDPHPEQTRSEEISVVEKGIKTALGEQCQIEWNFVDEIPPSPSGKHLHTISKVRAYHIRGETP